MTPVGVSANHKEDGVESRRKAWVWRAWFSMAGMVLLMGCGEVGGAGQCFGTGTSGLCVTLDSIVPTDKVTGFGDTNSIDAFQSDCDGDTIPDETWGDHAVTVTFSAFLMPGVESPPAPSSVTWTNYLVTLVPNPSNQVSPPALTGYDYAFSGRLDTNSSLTVTLLLVSAQVKNEYVGASGSSNPGSIYTVSLQFIGKTEFNKTIVLGGQTTITMADFDHC